VSPKHFEVCPEFVDVALVDRTSLDNQAWFSAHHSADKIFVLFILGDGDNQENRAPQKRSGAFETEYLS
jgi:hypothetical protein